MYRGCVCNIGAMKQCVVINKKILLKKHKYKQKELKDENKEWYWYVEIQREHFQVLHVSFPTFV